jgi:hypothetical protein
MTWTTGRPALWFGDDAEESLFYPFGADGPGYIVAARRRRGIMRWVCWRGRWLAMLWIFAFVAVVDVWAPSFSATGKLQPETLFAAIAMLTPATLALAWIGDRAVFAIVLFGCPAVDAAPTPIERETCVGQVGLSPANLHQAFFSVSPCGLAAGALTILLGVINSDAALAVAGAVLFALSAYGFTRPCAPAMKAAPDPSDMIGQGARHEPAPQNAAITDPANPAKAVATPESIAFARKAA